MYDPVCSLSLRGESGTKFIDRATFILSRGNSTRDGVQKLELNADFHWTKVTEWSHVTETRTSSHI